VQGRYYGLMSDDFAASLREEFVRLLTTDSPHQDKRRRDFNQAVFMADGGAVWTATDLGMIMGKFDKAVRNVGGG
jgi:hypothetical protein